MVSICSLGEALIDFIPSETGRRLCEATSFSPAPGGAPANVAVGVSRLGTPSAFLGKIASDPFGDLLTATLTESDVNTTGVARTDEAKTSLAFVSLRADGERDFLFYRDPGADMLYRPDEVDEGLIADAGILHFGSISLIAEPSRSATLHALDLAEASGTRISYDPNLRFPLWADAHDARAGLLLGWSRARLIKASDDEIRFLSGTDDLESGTRALWTDRLDVVCVTQAGAGVTVFTADSAHAIPGLDVDAVDATGAGDAFVAALLSELAAAGPEPFAPEVLAEAARFANAAAALSTTRSGAIPSLPTRAEVEAQTVR